MPTIQYIKGNRSAAPGTLLTRRALLAAAPLALTGAEPALAPKRRIRLFNGRNFDGWYTWLLGNQYADPNRVFTVDKGILRISGMDWGGLTTKAAYRDYHLVAEWKWAGPAHGERAAKARDSGILLHGRGRDGAYKGIWLESIECQIIEGGCGDFILVGGDTQPSLTAKVRQGENNQLYWDPKGEPVTRTSGRFNWFGRDPGWKDELGFRGSRDLEKPVGEWNRSEAICRGDRISNLVNGVVVNEGYASSPSEGKIQIQSEGAEIWFRRIDLLPVKA